MLCDLKIAEAFVLDEFLCKNPRGRFERGGDGFVVCPEQTPAPSRFPDQRCDDGFGSDRLARHCGQSFKRDGRVGPVRGSSTVNRHSSSRGNWTPNIFSD